ncbi:metacaspase-1-like [Bidens hawaiensis]|uniref:metacaspase-1-like n=1 Tax=Bidens hawaiensis TaxID=980011 RepID=UPI0040490C7E
MGRCNTCQRITIRMPGSQYRICPVCKPVNLFNRKIMNPVLFRTGQFINAATNRYQHDLQRKQQPPQLQHYRIHQQLPHTHGRKRAVLCGITYNGHKRKLEASVLNVRSMQQLLVNKLGFPNASILILTEEESDRSRIPTKRKIQEALQWLVQGCQPGDSLLFYYAGHACRVPDEHGDEVDGYDSALCPLDYRVAGVIIDDEINATLVAPLPHGVTLHTVVDTCFSGTLLDLPFLCKISWDGLYKWEEHQLRVKGTRGGKAVCISACADDQYSADTSAFTGKAIGALTFSFIQTIENESKLTYGTLLSSMRRIVHHAQQVACRLLPRASSMLQEPQLSSVTRFEIHSEPIIF